MPSENQPPAEWKEYPEPEFPEDWAREAYRKARAAIKEAWQWNVRFLNYELVGLQLTVLPPEIGNLTKLESVSLHGNYLTSLPAEIGNLKSLRQLWLHYNQFASLPSVIGKLSSLRFLSIANNKLESLPKEIGSLNQLREFLLFENQLATLPGEIGRLTALTRLHLSHNQLTALPPEIGQLTELTQLHLSHNQLTALPPEVGQLTYLTHLDLDNNQLTALPPEIGQLTALPELFLHNNQLTALPPEIGRLKKLVRLNVAGNRLESLPPEIGGLGKLKQLNLDNNRLRSLPYEMGNQRELAVLGLGGNQIEDLSDSLRNCKSLTHIFLHENPALRLPADILGPDPRLVDHTRAHFPKNSAAILDYYLSRRKGDSALNEIKIILTGRGGSGKTSLVDRLVWQKFDRFKYEMTQGISLCDWTMRDCPGEEVTAHVWDFAGQVIVRAMHQYFYSARTVYLLVLTGREDSARKDAEEFMRLIKAYGMDGEQGPPVIVVLNKWEDSGSARPKLDRGALREKYPFIVDYIETDCATEYGLERLRGKIMEVVSGLEYVRAPWGKDWAAVKDALRTLTAQRQHIPYAEFRKVCAQHGVTRESEQDSLAYALHALGLALNFRNDPRLCDSTVLNPHWLVEHSYGLIRWADAHGGRLRRADLADAMPEEADPGMRDYMARILERFEICYAIEGKEAWLVPQSLNAESPPEALGYMDLPPEEVTRLRYRYTVLPEDLVPKFIVRTHSFIAEEHQVWSTGVLLTKNGATALVRMGEEADREVNITVRGPAEDRQVLAGLVLAEFRRIHETARTLTVTEETEVVTPSGPVWVNVRTLEVDDAFLRKTGVQTDKGTVMVDPVPELNEFTKPEARDDSWKPVVFVSYAHADDKQRKELMVRLNIMVTHGLLDRDSVWHDRLLRPGEDWDGEIKSQLERADIIVLLISAASMASTYINNIELKRALERAAAGEVVAVPVILDGTDWKKAEYPELDLKLSRFQALCADKPVLKHSPQRDAWEKVETGLREILTKLKARGPRR